jgi:hypothetical protein
MQPLWYLFICLLYVGQSAEVKSPQERTRKVLFAPLYMVLQQTKLLSGLEDVHRWHNDLVGYDEVFNLTTLEGSFRIQTFVEMFMHTIPLMIIQSSSNNSSKWTGNAKLTMLVMIVMLIKNLCLVTIFAIRKYIDGTYDPQMRPLTSQR